MSAKPQVSVGLSLFGLSVQIHDVLSFFGKRLVAGPFVIIERRTGAALETSHDAVRGWQPWLGDLNGGPGQRWLFERSGVKSDKRSKEEILIRSGVNGLVLDSTWEERDHAPVLLWEMHGAAVQRWRLRRAADGLAWSIASAKDGRVIDVGPRKDRTEDTHPSTWKYDGGRHQQFLLLPIG